MCLSTWSKEHASPSRSHMPESRMSIACALSNSTICHANIVCATRATSPPRGAKKQLLFLPPSQNMLSPGHAPLTCISFLRSRWFLRSGFTAGYPSKVRFGLSGTQFMHTHVYASNHLLILTTCIMSMTGRTLHQPRSLTSTDSHSLATCTPQALRPPDGRRESAAKRCRGGRGRGR